MKDSLLLAGIILIVLIVGGFIGYFYGKSRFDSSLPYLLQPLRDSIMATEKRLDSVIAIPQEDFAVKIKYKYIYLKNKENEAIQDYKQLDTSTRVRVFHEWVSTLPSR